MPPVTLPDGLTLYDFDTLYTAPQCGFRDALDYYQQCSAAPVVPQITLLCFILFATHYPVGACASHCEHLPTEDPPTSCAPGRRSDREHAPGCGDRSPQSPQNTRKARHARGGSRVQLPGRSMLPERRGRDGFFFNDTATTE